MSSAEKTPSKGSKLQEQSKNEDMLENNPKLPAWAQRNHSEKRLAIQTSPVIRRHAESKLSSASPSMLNTDSDEDVPCSTNDEQDDALSFFRLSRSPLPPDSPLVAGQAQLTAPPTTGRI